LRRLQAEALPFPAGSFDAVTCQFGLMFFDDRVAALKEMWRVLRPGGHLAVAVWDALERTPGYAAMADLLRDLFGTEVADALRAPFLLGDPKDLLALFAQAAILHPHLQTLNGTARFPSIESWVHTDVRGWTLADVISEAQYDTLLAEARKSLTRFVGANRTVAFPAPAHIVTAVKPEREASTDG
jgi:SAM-dependent methyltransferase